MDWFEINWCVGESENKFPKLSENGQIYKCLGFCRVRKSDSYWEGFIEVYFDPHIGWKRCETDESIEVLRWTHLSGIDQEK